MNNQNYKPELYRQVTYTWGFPGGPVVKNPPYVSSYAGDIRDMSSIPGSARFQGGGHGSPHQCSCLGNLIYRRALRATVHRVTKSQT